MVTAFSLFLILIILSICIAAAFFIGKKWGTKNISTSFINNQQMIKEITELGMIEVQGVSTFTSGNTSGSSDWFQMLKKYFIEQTVTIYVPYIAKYGFNLKDDRLMIKRDNMGAVVLHLPPPQLLSFELRLDKIDSHSKSGILIMSDDAKYKQAQKNLYQQGRTALISDEQHLDAAKKRVTELLQHYFKTINKPVTVLFDREIAKVDNKLNSLLLEIKE